MTTLIDRYRSGDCQAVRSLLLASIDADASGEQLAVATEVADEFVSRSIANLSQLYEALLAIEYRFFDADAAFVLHEFPDEDSVAEFEKRMGKMPLLAARWYRQIKSLNFRQDYRQLTDPASPLAGLGWNMAFIVESLTEAANHWEQHRAQQEENDLHAERAGYPKYGPLTPALLTGGCATNNDCKGFDLPSFRFDDVLYNDGGGDRYFGDEIAEAFLCKGFPSLVAPERVRKFVRDLYGEPDREYLSKRLPSRLDVV